MLWDIEGRDGARDVNGSYVRGAHGIIYVVDGTRRETVDQIFEMRDNVTRQVGDVPSVIALNKIDLTDEWKLDAGDEQNLASKGIHLIRTSAKTGEGVGATFQWLADATVAAGGKAE